jgi:hypothetical protein
MVSTEKGRLSVVDIPAIKSLSGLLHYPKYSKQLSREVNEQSADIVALRGSYVNYQINSNKKIKNAYIVFEKTNVQIDDTTAQQDTFHIPLKINEYKASGTMSINQNGQYHFVIEDFDSLFNINPIKYSVVAVNDGSPSISFIFPLSDVQVTEQALLPIKVAILDDYGFSSLNLNYRLIASKYAYPEEHFSAIPINLLSSDIAQEVGYV